MHAVVMDNNAVASLSGSQLKQQRVSCPDMPWCPQVAADEASHFQLLQKRLEAVGSHYGALPVHDGLWESAAATAHSLPARLAVESCVHEARGLDRLPHTIQRFQNGGDRESADLLKIIYQVVVYLLNLECPAKSLHNLKFSAFCRPLWLKHLSLTQTLQHALLAVLLLCLSDQCKPRQLHCYILSFAQHANCLPWGFKLQIWSDRKCRLCLRLCLMAGCQREDICIFMLAVPCMWTSCTLSPAGRNKLSVLSC